MSTHLTLPQALCWLSLPYRKAPHLDLPFTWRGAWTALPNFGLLSWHQLVVFVLLFAYWLILRYEKVYFTIFSHVFITAKVISLYPCFVSAKRNVNNGNYVNPLPLRIPSINTEVCSKRVKKAQNNFKAYVGLQRLTNHAWLNAFGTTKDTHLNINFDFDMLELILKERSSNIDFILRKQRSYQQALIHTDSLTCRTD